MLQSPIVAKTTLVVSCLCLCTCTCANFLFLYSFFFCVLLLTEKAFNTPPTTKNNTFSNYLKIKPYNKQFCPLIERQLLLVPIASLEKYIINFNAVIVGWNDQKRKQITLNNALRGQLNCNAQLDL